MNPLDYFFGDLEKTKVYQGRAGVSFSSEEELKTKIKAVWKDCATDLKPLRKVIKQFVPRLRAVEEKQGCCVKMISGWLNNLQWYCWVVATLFNGVEFRWKKRRKKYQKSKIEDQNKKLTTTIFH